MFILSVYFVVNILVFNISVRIIDSVSKNNKAVFMIINP